MTVKISAQDAFSDTLGKYNAQLGQAQQATERTAQATNQLGTAIGGAIAAVGIQQVIQFAEGFNELGTQVNANKALFAQLTQGMGDQAAIMDQLRASTGGVVSNMDLMGNSAQLLRLGIAKNTGDLNDLLGMIVKLKSPTEDTTQAISNFALMLSNNSVMRLDSFGLSASVAKDRIEELKNAGMDASEAFKQATLEQMRDQVERLGDAATATQTPLLRLQTDIVNIMQTGAGNFSTGVNAIVGLAQAIGDHPDVLLGTHTELGKNENADNPGFQALMRNAYLITNLSTNLGTATKNLYDFAAAQTQSTAQTIKSNEQLDLLKSRFADLQGQFGNITGIEQWYQPGAQQMPQYIDATQNQQIQDITDRIIENAKAIKDQFGDLIPESQKNNLDMMAKSAKELSDQAQKAADAFKNMKLSDILGTSSGGIAGEISDQVMAAAQNSGMSSSALKALQDTLDLSSGRQTAASQSEQKFAAGLVGLPPDQVAKAISNWVASQQAAALAGLSGQQLAGSEQYFAGMVGGGPSQRITIKPGQGLNEVMRQYNLTQQQLQAAGAYKNGILSQGAFNVGGMGQVNPNFNPQDAIDQYMKSIGMLGQGGGQGGTDLAATTTQAKEDFASMQTSTQSITDGFKQVGELLGQISNTTYIAKIRPDAPEWFVKLLTGGQSAFELIAQTTQANGGRPPGSNSSKPRGGPVVDR